MEPLEDIIEVLAIFVGLPWAVFAGIAKVKAAKAVEQGGLRASELQALVRSAVADAVDPLRQRVETLEAIATDDEPRRRTSDTAGDGRLDPAVLAGAFPSGGADVSGADPAEERVARRRARD